MCGSLLTRDNVDEEIKHVGLCERRGNVGALQRAPLVFLGMNPGSHGELRDEYVAALGEEDGRFGGYHLDFGIGLHDLFDASEGQLMNLVVVRVALQVADGLLPVSRQDVLVLACEALVNLERRQ